MRRAKSATRATCADPSRGLVSPSSGPPSSTQKARSESVSPTGCQLGLQGRRVEIPVVCEHMHHTPRSRVKGWQFM